MQLQLFCEGVNLMEQEREYITKKILHLEKYASDLIDESSSVRVDVRHNKLKHSGKLFLVQVTLFVHPSILRAEESGTTLEESVDLVEEKLKKQVERYKGKHHRRGQGGEWIPESTLEQLTHAQNEAPLAVTQIMKRKKLNDLQSMHEDEAIEQLELIGHDFFIFNSKDTGLISVAYRRKDDTYGVIEVEKFESKKW